MKSYYVLSLGEEDDAPKDVWDEIEALFIKLESRFIDYCYIEFDWITKEEYEKDDELQSHMPATFEYLAKKIGLIGDPVLLHLGW